MLSHTLPFFVQLCSHIQYMCIQDQVLIVSSVLFLVFLIYLKNLFFFLNKKPRRKTSKKKKMDPILQTNENRFVLFPIQYDNLWQLYKKAEASFWTAEEIDLGADEFDKLLSDEQHFVKHVLAFFAASDGIVLENLAGRFLEEVQIAEARAFYSNQAFMETIHNETYSLLIDTYVKDTEEKKKLFQAIENFESIKKKYEWSKRYMDKSLPFSTRVVAFAAVEGIFFSGAFCCIFWLKKRGLMPGLTFSNELISRDEGLHCDFACELHRTMQPENRANHEVVRDIIKSAVEVEECFITESLPCALIGMNADLMKQYIQFVADRLYKDITDSEEPIYGAKNPFDWMELISLQGKTNFFEKRVGEYALSASSLSKQSSFTMDADF